MERNTGFVTVSTVEFTPVLHAIERARWRIAVYPMKSEPVEFAKVFAEELANIVEAKDAYDRAVDAASKAPRKPEREEYHTPAPLVLRGSPNADAGR